jgi:hypothetical protein
MTTPAQSDGGTPPQHVAVPLAARLGATEAAGSYHTYHYGMFQGGTVIPHTPRKVSEPDFSPFHRAVFDTLTEDPWAEPSLGVPECRGHRGSSER